MISSEQFALQVELFVFFLFPFGHLLKQTADIFGIALFDLSFVRTGRQRCIKRNFCNRDFVFLFQLAGVALAKDIDLFANRYTYRSGHFT